MDRDSWWVRILRMWGASGCWRGPEIYTLSCAGWGIDWPTPRYVRSVFKQIGCVRLAASAVTLLPHSHTECRQTPGNPCHPPD
jgi:hypothetical protein